MAFEWYVAGRRRAVREAKDSRCPDVAKTGGTVLPATHSGNSLIYAKNASWLTNTGGCKNFLRIVGVDSFPHPSGDRGGRMPSAECSKMQQVFNFAVLKKDRRAGASSGC